MNRHFFFNIFLLYSTDPEFATHNIGPASIKFLQLLNWYGVVPRSFLWGREKGLHYRWKGCEGEGVCMVIFKSHRRSSASQHNNHLLDHLMVSIWVGTYWSTIRSNQHIEHKPAPKIKKNNTSSIPHIKFYYIYITHPCKKCFFSINNISLLNTLYSIRLE